MCKAKIAWITFNAFIDTDYYIVKELSTYYSVDWYIIKSENDRLEYTTELDVLNNTHAISIHILTCGRRLRSISCISFYRQLIKTINEKEPAIIYSTMAGAPYFIPVLFLYKGKNKVVLAIHNVHVPKGGSGYWFFKLYNSLTIKWFNNFQTFSLNQFNLLRKKAPEKNICYTPFILKDYGTSAVVRSDKKLTFLSFGNIRRYKRIDVLIEAAQEAYVNTGVLFRVIIAGKCDEWDFYSKKIQYPELFDLRIHRIDNHDIPDLFAESDYFVAPYQDIAQSGSSLIAINYGIPMIASKLPAFEEFIEDKINGRLIKPADVDSLKTVLEDIILSNNSTYETMKENLCNKREELYSTKTIVEQYIRFIDGIIGQ